jgi:t-SNARE complex subunit (syntaxin)
MQNRYNKRSNFEELRKNDLTSRAGFGWECGEEDKLLAMRSDKNSYDDIAAELKRTSRSIQTRLYQHICKLTEVDSTQESELFEKYDVSVEELTEFKTKRDEHSGKMLTKKRTNTRQRDESLPYIPRDTRNNQYDVRNELNVLRQEVRDLRREVRDLSEKL